MQTARPAAVARFAAPPSTPKVRDVFGGGGGGGGAMGGGGSRRGRRTLRRNQGAGEDTTDKKSVSKVSVTLASKSSTGVAAVASGRKGSGDDDTDGGAGGGSDVSVLSSNTKRSLSLTSGASRSTTTCCSKGDRRSQATLLTTPESTADLTSTTTGAVATILHLPSKVDYYPGGLAAPLYKLFRAVEARRADYIEELRTVLGVRSVSSRPDCWPNVVQMLQWVQDRLKRMGATTELMEVSVQPGVRDHNGRPLTPPPVLLATIGPVHVTDRRRVLVYLHVDVAGLWGAREAEAPPCGLTLSDDKRYLHGRGVFECKGPLMCWLLALETLYSLRHPLPVSLKFIIQGAHEIGSPGLEELLRTRRRNFLRDVDMICVTKLSWLKDKPCVVHGLRGLVYFHLEVMGGTANLDSGHFGGAVHEPMADLVYLLNALQDHKGDPAVEGLNASVAPVTREEQVQMAHVAFDAEDLRKALGAPQLRHQRDSALLLRHRWRMPTISFHGVEGAQAAPGMATAIPRAVVGKFSVRLVPHQAPERVATAVRRHVDAAWAQRASANAMHLSVTAMARPWLEDPSSPHFCAARRAIKRVYKEEADVIRDGGSMEVVLLLQRLCPRSLVVMPLGQAPDGGGGPHTTEECMRVSHFLDGIKLVATYLFEVAQLEGPQPAVRATNIRLQQSCESPRRRTAGARPGAGAGAGPGAGPGAGAAAAASGGIAAAVAAAAAAAAAGAGGGVVGGLGGGGAAGAGAAAVAGAGVGAGAGGAPGAFGRPKATSCVPGGSRSHSRRPASERRQRRGTASAAAALATQGVDALRRKPRFRW